MRPWPGWSPRSSGPLPAGPWQWARAGHLPETLHGAVDGLEVSRIDPAAAVQAYRDHVIATKGKDLDEAGRAVLAEDLLSPCTEEIAVFQQFSRVLSESRRRFVVVDTAATGQTLLPLLLDATGSYHRRRPTHRAHAPGAAAGRHRLLPPRGPPPHGKLEELHDPPHAPTGPSPDEGHPGDPRRDHTGPGSPGPAGGPGARGHPSLGVGHQQLHRRRPPRGALPAATRRQRGRADRAGEGPGRQDRPRAPPRHRTHRGGTPGRTGRSHPPARL